jgi:hypothetical protein
VCLLTIFFIFCGFVQAVQRDHSAINEVDGTIGTVGSKRESQASDLDIHGLRWFLHRLSVSDQDGSGYIIGVFHDLPVVQLGSPSRDSTGGDTHIPTKDRGENTIENDGGSSVDSEVLIIIILGDRLETGCRRRARAGLGCILGKALGSTLGDELGEILGAELEPALGEAPGTALGQAEMSIVNYAVVDTGVVLALSLSIFWQVWLRNIGFDARRSGNSVRLSEVNLMIV